MVTPVPGWYSDPSAPTTQIRWWNGAAWTEHTHPHPTATVPVSASHSSTSVPIPSEQDWYPVGTVLDQTEYTADGAYISSSEVSAATLKDVRISVDSSDSHVPLPQQVHEAHLPREESAGYRVPMDGSPLFTVTSEPVEASDASMAWLVCTELISLRERRGASFPSRRALLEEFRRSYPGFRVIPLAAAGAAHAPLDLVSEDLSVAGEFILTVGVHLTGEYRPWAISFEETHFAIWEEQPDGSLHRQSVAWIGR